jgi:hypothetical protein
MAVSSDIEVAAEGQLQKLAKEALPAVAIPAEAVPFPAPAKTVAPSDAEKSAMRLLAKLAGDVQVTTRRAMTDTELKALFDETEAAKIVAAWLKRRDTAIGAMVRHHADVTAEEQGLVVPRAQVVKGKVLTPATDRTKDGYYQLAQPENPYRVNVPGTGKAWSLEYTSGSTSVSGTTLNELHKAGKVTREEYLAMTEPPRPQERVLSAERALAFIKKNSERGVAILKEITSQAPSGASLYVRKQG